MARARRALRSGCPRECTSPDAAPACGSYPDASGAADDAYGFVKAIGKFKATQRTNGISTSDLILRLVKVRPPAASPAALR